MFEDLLARLVELPPGPVYALIAALAGLENLFPPVPADTAVALGAFLASVHQRISAPAIFGVTLVGNLATAAGVYAGARTAGRAFFRTDLGRRLINPAALARIEDLHARYGVWGIFASRFIPGVRAVVPPFAGLAGLDAARALIPMAVASALWYGTIIWIASTLLRRIEDVQRLVGSINRAGLVLGAVLVVGVIVLLLRRRRRTG